MEEEEKKLRGVSSKQQGNTVAAITGFGFNLPTERSRMVNVMKEANQLKNRYAGVIQNLKQKLAKSEAILEKATQHLEEWLTRDETFKEVLLLNRSVSVNTYYSVGPLLNIVTVVEEQGVLRNRLIVTNLNSIGIGYNPNQSTVSVLVALKNTNLADAISLPMNILVDTTGVELYSIIYHVLVSEYIIKEGITFQLFNDGRYIPKDNSLVVTSLICDGEYGISNISVRILYSSDFDVDLLPPDPFYINNSNCGVLFFGDPINTRIVELDMTQMSQLKCVQVFAQLRKKRMNIEKLRIICITGFISL